MPIALKEKGTIYDFTAVAIEPTILSLGSVAGVATLLRIKNKPRYLPYLEPFLF